MMIEKLEVHEKHDTDPPGSEPSVLASHPYPTDVHHAAIALELDAMDRRERWYKHIETLRVAATKRNEMIAWLAQDAARAHGLAKRLRGRYLSERAQRKQLQAELAAERAALVKVTKDADHWSERAAEAKDVISGLMLRIKQLEARSHIEGVTP